MGSIWPPQCILRARVSVFDWGRVGGLVTDRGDVAAAAVVVVNGWWAGGWRRFQRNLPWRDLWKSRSGRKLSPIGLEKTKLALKTTSSITSSTFSTKTINTTLVNTISTLWISPHFLRFQPQPSKCLLLGFWQTNSTQRTIGKWMKKNRCVSKMFRKQKWGMHLNLFPCTTKQSLQVICL